MSGVEFGDPRLPPRFWSKVRVDVSGCWIWDASVTHNGYGRFQLNSKVRRSHVLATLLNGPKPDQSMTASHLCHVHACVNPDHLVWESLRDNCQRSAVRITHCPKGHEYTTANTYRHRMHGGRCCRTCHLANDKVRRERLKPIRQLSTENQPQSPSA